MKNEPFDMDFFLELLYVVAGSYLQTGFMIGSGNRPGSKSNNDNIEALNNLINYVKSTINTKETKNV